MSAPLHRDRPSPAERRETSIAYIDPRPVPGDTVESLQIAQNVDAWARACGPITLVTPQPAGDDGLEPLVGRPWNAHVERAYLPDYRKRFWLPSRSNRMFFAAAARWVAAHRPDVAWVRHLRLADALLRARAAPAMIFETHEVFARTFAEQRPGSTWKAARLARLERRVYGASLGVIALTSALARDLADDYGIASRVIVAADGYDPILSSRAVPARRYAEPVILYLGSLHPWKGVDVLVRAMKHVPRARLVVVGGEPDRVASLGALAVAEGVAERVELVGPVPPARRFDWIACADVCALPLSGTLIASRYTSPLKLFEYLAAGKPVVSTDLPSVRVVVTHDVDAWLVAGPDPGQYGAALSRLIEDGALRARLGTAARATATRYTWDARARAIAAFVEARRRASEVAA